VCVPDVCSGITSENLCFVDCEWNASEPVGEQCSSTNCTRLHNEEDCGDDDNGCVSDREGSCTEDVCKEYETEAECPKECEFKDGKCKPNECTRLHNETDCYLGCEMDTNTNSCKKDECSDVSNSDDCVSVDKGCMWTKPSPKLPEMCVKNPCSVENNGVGNFTENCGNKITGGGCVIDSFGEKEDCVPNPCYGKTNRNCPSDCIWNGEECLIDSCTRLHNEEDCYEGCMMDIKKTNSCIPNVCYNKSEEDCKNISCSWENDKCEWNDCVRLDSSSSCIKGCQETSDDRCVPDICLGLNSSDCNNSDCVWNSRKNKCEWKDCVRENGNDNCIEKEGCVESNGKCVINVCVKDATKEECFGDCWNVKDEICKTVPGRCVRLHGEEDCPEGCEFDPTRAGSCIRDPCFNVSNKEECEEKNCNWNINSSSSSTGKCEWKCTSWNEDGDCEEKDPCLRVHNETECYDWCVKTGNSCSINPCYKFTVRECSKNENCVVIEGEDGKDSKCDVTNCTLINEGDTCDPNKNCRLSENGNCVPDSCREASSDGEGKCPEGCKHENSNSENCTHDPCSSYGNTTSCGSSTDYNCSWIDEGCTSNDECLIKDGSGNCKDGCVKDLINQNTNDCIVDPCAAVEFELLCSNFGVGVYSCKWDDEKEVCRTDNFTCTNAATGECVESCVKDVDGECKPNICNQLTPAQCEQLDYCIIRDNSCTENDCLIPVYNEETGENECRKGCSYNTDRELCTIDVCRQYSLSGDCVENEFCVVYQVGNETICVFDEDAARSESGDDEDLSKGSGFPWWIIIVIVVVVVVLLIGLCILIGLFMWKRKKDKEKEALEDAELLEAEDAVEAEKYEVPAEDDGVDALKFGDLTLDALVQGGASAEVAGVAAPTANDQPTVADLMINPSQSSLAVIGSSGKQNYQNGSDGNFETGSQSSLVAAPKKKGKKNEDYSALDDNNNNEGGLFKDSSLSQIGVKKTKKKKKKKDIATIENDV
jgi:hypothetical protein